MKTTIKRLLLLAGVGLSSIGLLQAQEITYPEDETTTQGPGDYFEEVDAAEPMPELELDELPGEDQVTLELPAGNVSEAGVSVTKEDTITVDFPEEDVRTIIRNVAELYELNVVIPPELVGTASIKLADVTWRQIFDVVLDPLGYTFKIDENIVKIVSTEEMNAEPVDTQIFIINYADAASLQATLAPMVDAAAGGRIQVDTRSNALIITEQPTRLAKMASIITQLDDPVLLNGQVHIEAKFVDVTVSDNEALGLDWQGIDGMRLGDFGVEAQFAHGWGALDGNGLDSGASFSVLSSPEFNVVLRALENDGQSRLVSNPTLITLNNTEASINVGQEYPIPSYTYNEEIGRFEVSGFEYRPIGINLVVTPQITGGGESINLKVVPEIAEEPTSFITFSGADIPIIKNKKVETTVVLKDSYTLAIGGLIDVIDASGYEQVPLFGDIPGIGKLFQNKNQNLTRRNLLIFVTAKILSMDTADYRNTVDPRTLQELNLSEADIPGYELPENQRERLQRLFELRTRIDENQQGSSIEEDNAEADLILNPPPPPEETESKYSNPRGRH